MSEEKNTSLFAKFPPVTKDEWEAKIHADLKGADYEKRLVWRTPEGFNVQPYYRADDIENLQHTGSLPGEYPFVRSNKSRNNEWYIRQDIDAANPEEANKKARDVLMKGATAIGFVFPHKMQPTKAQWQQLLKDLHLPAIELNLVTGHISVDSVKAFVETVEETGFNPEQVRGSFCYDPIEKLTMRGNFCQSAEHSFDKAKQLIEATEKLPHFAMLDVQGNQFSHAGATIVQQLAFALATGTEYLAALTDRNLSVNTIAPKMKFTLSVGSTYFMEIAKLRAARLLWAKITESYLPCCPEKMKMNLHAVTSRWNKTAYDPYVNMLRTTTEAMSATIAGVDSLTVEPFDSILGETSDFSERIARNQQILLKEEAYFDKIIDPAGGSYYIENLTNSIATHAWNLFLEIEEKGGYIAAFKAGFIQKQIKETVQKREMNMAMRKEVLVGINQYPNFDERRDTLSEQLLQPETKQPADTVIAEPLTVYRGAMAFERLRNKTDRSSHRPKVFLFTYGNLAMRRARSTFSSNFFACAGFEVVDNLGFKNVEDGVKAALEAKADIVVVCSADDAYPEIAPEIQKQLDGKAIVVVAGYPKDSMEQLKAAGVTNFIHVKSNVLETLEYYQKQLGIE